MRKKLLAPLIITVLVLLALVGYGVLCACTPLPLVLRIVGCAALLGLSGVSVYVLIERIKEIRSGEEDDISQY